MKRGIYEADDCFENQITNNIINYYEERTFCSLYKGLTNLINQLIKIFVYRFDFFFC